MANEDNHVYGFNFHDATALVNGIPRGSGRESRLHTHPMNPAIKRLVHFKSPAGGIPAFDEATGQMGSAICDKHNSNSTGLLSSAGTTLTIYNAAGAFAGNKYGVADYNEAGLLVAIVEKC